MSPKALVRLIGLAAALWLCAGAASLAQEPSSSDTKQDQSQQAPKTPPPKPGEEAQNPPAKPEEKQGETQQPPKAPPKPGEETQKPAQKPAAPGQLKLETPETAPETEKAPGASKPAAQQAGPPVIEDIIIRGARRIPAATLRARIFTHKGDVYEENALERDFMALWNTGFLDDVRFEITEGDKGKILTIYVREKKLVRSIDYKGLSTVQQSDVLDRYKERKVGLSIQSQYDPVVVKRAEVVLQQLLAEHGRQFATVRARTRNIPPNSVALTFIVVEGPKVKVGKIRFQGNTVISSYRLERTMKLSRPVGAPPWFYWFHKTYDKEKVEYDLEKIRELYQEHGYFYALPKEPQSKMVDTRRRWPFFFWSWGHGKRVDLSVPIEEGEQYHLGKFVIRGNKLFKQQQLAPILMLRPGDVFNLTRVKKSIENYTKLYGQFGYINFTANPDIEPDRKKHTINLYLDFEEEKQFFVHRIEFSGNTKTRDKVIRRELMLDEGNVFNSTLWELSVLRVNQLGFFDQVKKEDYDIKQNPRDSTVDINLKVKEKGRNSIGFSGGISGLAGNFVGFNYATNNFLGLGETLSLEAEWGTFQKLYTFGFTEPYLLDRPITTGFTIFKSSYHYDQLRTLGLSSGINPALLVNSPLAQFTQNFQQNSAGFTVFSSYPLRRIPFGRLGLTYSYTISSLQAFNTASQAFFQAINFRGLQGPNALSGITSSQVMPTFMYNTINDSYNPMSGKSIYTALSFSGSVLGGNVNTIRPIFEARYYHPINRRRNAIGLRFMASEVTGYGGRVVPPFSRFYVGGEDDIRGFDIRSVSPVAFYPTIGQVCNRDVTGQPIWAVASNGLPLVGSCGSFTRFPYNTIIFPGGDSTALTSFEYRIPIAGPVTVAFFTDAGTNFILRDSQLKIQPNALTSISDSFPNFPLPSVLRPVGTTNFHPRISSGMEVQVILPIVNAPIRVFYGYNVMRLNTVAVPPQNFPDRSLFPNDATYDTTLPFFLGLRLRERKGRVGFTLARQF